MKDAKLVMSKMIKQLRYVFEHNHSMYVLI